ncbi:MAG: ketopantoate reductase family protein [Planctomycetota bacterium]|jgi:2-dehydropantoate 2-reductase
MAASDVAESAVAGQGSARLLIAGVGGIGGTIAATLLDRPSALLGSFVPLTTNHEVASAVATHGWRLREEEGERVLRGVEVASELPADTAPFDFVLLATRPPQVEEAARAALPHLKPSGALVCLQNGLCEERLAAIAGPERVLGAIVAWGGSMPRPGVFERTSGGGFTIGRLDGKDDPRLEQLATLLEPVGPVRCTENLRGARWSKLAINAAISTLGTIGGTRLGALLRHRFVRRVALEIMTEAVQVAQAAGAHLEKVAGTLDLGWIALKDDERRSRGSASLVAKHTVLLAVGTRYRRLRSSMLRAIERGRKPAVDFLNGEIVDRAKALGIPAPINELARDLVHAIARGEVSLRAAVRPPAVAEVA